MTRRDATDPRGRRGRSEPGSLCVLWEGEGEAAVDKPAGLSSERPASHRSAGGDPASSAALDSAIARARGQLGWPDARLPHRLDRPTRGILMVARDARVAARHAEEQRQGLWTKWYVARVPARSDRGDPAEALVGLHRAYLRREGRLSRCVRSGGDPSSLEVLAAAPATDAANPHAHLAIRLDTGRYHQIRAMLAHLGFPLVGDRDYGATPEDAALELLAIQLRIARASGDVRIRIPSERLPRLAAGLVASLHSALEGALNAGAQGVRRTPAPPVPPAP